MKRRTIRITRTVGFTKQIEVRKSGDGKRLLMDTLIKRRNSKDTLWPNQLTPAQARELAFVLDQMADEAEAGL